MGDLGDPALLPLPLARPRDAGGYEGVVDVLVQEDPEPTVESGDIKQGVVEVLGLVLQGGQDLHHQLVRYPVAVYEVGRPVVVEQQEADPAAGVEETVSLEAPVGLDIEGYLRDPGYPLQHLAGPFGGVDVLRERRGELVVRCLYRSSSGPGPHTKARRREVSELTREGLSATLEALEEGRVDVVVDVGVHYPGRHRLMYCQGCRTPDGHKTVKKGA